MSILSLCDLAVSSFPQQSCVDACRGTLWCQKILSVFTHLKLRYKDSTENCSPLSRWMWKLSSSVKLWAVKVKHPSEVKIRKTHFWVKRDFNLGSTYLIYIWSDLIPWLTENIFKFLHCTGYYPNIFTVCTQSTMILVLFWYFFLTPSIEMKKFHMYLPLSRSYCLFYTEIIGSKTLKLANKATKSYFSFNCAFKLIILSNYIQVVTPPMLIHSHSIYCTVTSW